MTKQRYNPLWEKAQPNLNKLTKTQASFNGKNPKAARFPGFYQQLQQHLSKEHDRALEMILVRRQPVCTSHFVERLQRIHPGVMTALVTVPRAVAG